MLLINSRCQFLGPLQLQLICCWVKAVKSIFQPTTSWEREQPQMRKQLKLCSLFPQISAFLEAQVLSISVAEISSSAIVMCLHPWRVKIPSEMEEAPRYKLFILLTLLTLLREGLRNGNFLWHLPWRGGASCVVKFVFQFLFKNYLESLPGCYT